MSLPNEAKITEALTTGEAAEVLRLSPNTLRYWRHIGEGPRSFRLGPRRVMYKRSDLEQWYATQYEG